MTQARFVREAIKTATLTKHGIRRLVVSGIRTEQCCETTTWHASDLGWAVDYVGEATLIEGRSPARLCDASAGKSTQSERAQISPIRSCRMRTKRTSFCRASASANAAAVRPDLVRFWRVFRTAPIITSGEPS